VNVPAGVDQQCVPSPFFGACLVQPDDVFTQCGIQFRLASVTYLDEPNRTWVTFKDKAGNDMCDDVQIGGAMNSWQMRAKTEGDTVYGQINGGAPFAYFSAYTRGSTCPPDKLVYGVGGGNGLAMSTAILDTAGNEDGFLSFSHELGHVLGIMVDIDSTACHSLMCGGTKGSSRQHIIGCDMWRTDGTIPRNCVHDPADAVGVSTCSTWRSVAQAVVGSSSQPVPLEAPAATSGVASYWTVNHGTLSYNAAHFTQGTASVQVNSSGYTVLTSIPFRTADWGTVGTQLALDAYIPAGQPNPNWLGSVDVFVSIPSAVIFHWFNSNTSPGKSGGFLDVSRPRRLC
jgi:hypothetical protein